MAPAMDKSFGRERTISWQPPSCRRCTWPGSWPYAAPQRPTAYPARKSAETELLRNFCTWKAESWACCCRWSTQSRGFRTSLAGQGPRVGRRIYGNL